MPRAALVVAAIVVATAAGYLYGGQVRSPQTALAEAEDRSRSTLTAAVRNGRLTGTETFEGTVEWASNLEIAPTAQRSGWVQEVTRTPRARGDLLQHGEVILEIADRPLIALRGQVSMLRDLRPGDTGPDVRRLQEGLRDAGYFPGATDGEFGTLTLDAVRRLYRAVGHDLPGEAPPGKRGKAGRELPYLPASEIAFVPTLPARVTRVSTVGDRIDGPVATLGLHGIVVRVNVPTDQRATFTGDGGDEPRITVRIGRRERTRVVLDGVSAPREADGEKKVTVTLTQGQGQLDVDDVGRKAEISVSERASPTGLLVPISALYRAADLGSFVVAMRDGDETRIAVTVEATRDGVAMVTPTVPGALDVDDRVVIGTGSPDG
ncbi:hypothetical protein GCM10009668_33490 [Nocardioides dubius]|uniref:Peptidoglycan binding-like domain-containing protein n=1 Tax=Nocardioides dubius TaxID=317019 RepID=A0ABP4EHZ7_9ACTN